MPDGSRLPAVSRAGSLQVFDGRWSRGRWRRRGTWPDSSEMGTRPSGEAADDAESSRSAAGRVERRGARTMARPGRSQLSRGSRRRRVAPRGEQARPHLHYVEVALGYRDAAGGLAARLVPGGRGGAESAGGSPWPEPGAPSGRRRGGRRGRRGRLEARRRCRGQCGLGGGRVAVAVGKGDAVAACVGEGKRARVEQIVDLPNVGILDHTPALAVARVRRPGRSGGPTRGRRRSRSPGWRRRDRPGRARARFLLVLEPALELAVGVTLLKPRVKLS